MMRNIMASSLILSLPEVLRVKSIFFALPGSDVDDAGLFFGANKLARLRRSESSYGRFCWSV
jgi:hypothetical protein